MKIPPIGHPRSPQIVAAAWISFEVKCDAVKESPMVRTPKKNTCTQNKQTAISFVSHDHTSYSAICKICAQILTIAGVCRIYRKAYTLKITSIKWAEAQLA